MKIINIEELELSIIKWGIKEGFLFKNDISNINDNLVTICIVGRYLDKSCEVFIKGNYDSGCNGIIKPIKFRADTWEDLYYQLKDFFR